MAKTISNLLVGIGFDLDKKSTDQVGSGIDSIRLKALKLGGVVAGAFGIKALTSDFASAKDDLYKFSHVMGVSADNVSAMGHALELEGGSLGGFMSQLSGLEKYRNGFELGDIGFTAEALKAGVSNEALEGMREAKDAAAAYIILADEFKGKTTGQKLNMASAMGLDEASIRLLSKGRKAVEAVIAQQKKMRPETIAMSKAAAEFNDQTQNLGTNIGGFADRISAKVLPQLNNLIAGTNGWLDTNRDFINSGIDGFLDVIGENLLAVGVAFGALTAASSLGVAGAAIGAIGSKTNIAGLGKVSGMLGKLTKGFGVLAAAAAAWSVGQAIGEKINEGLTGESKTTIGGTIAHALAYFGNEEAQAAIDAERGYSDPVARKESPLVAGMADPVVKKESPLIAAAPINNQDYTATGKATETRAEKRTVNQMSGKSGGSSGQKQPIIITNNTVLDGRVISKSVHKVLAEQADTAVQDIASSEGG